MKIKFAYIENVCIFVPYKTKTTMTIQEINQNRNSNGVFSMSNDSCGWYAISRDNINMIVFYEAKWTFTQKDDVNRFYTPVGFAKRITQLLNKGY